MRRSLLPTLALLWCLAFSAQASSVVSKDETVAFFPGLAWRSASGIWSVEIRGCIFEQERRPGAATLFRNYLGIEEEDLNEAERGTLRERTRLFLIDAEGGKQLSVWMGGSSYLLNGSSSQGHFSRVLVFSEAAFAKLPRTNGTLGFEALLPPKDERKFSGLIHIVQPQGLSVISDIDDTIKVSEVLDRKKLLRNTFLSAFKPVDGMAALYRRWSTESNAVFHYVSGSPAQLNSPLAEFLEKNGFPSGSLHLSQFDWRQEIFHKKTTGPSPYKPSVIEPLLERFPERRFILVGDSGEFDPEIYGAVARKFLGQIERILIRDVTGDASSRYEKAFAGVPAEQWEVFKEPPAEETPLASP